MGHTCPRYHSSQGAEVPLKVGFWNRVAIVAGAAISLVWPSWEILSSNAQRREVYSSGYRECMKGVGSPGSNLTGDFCYDSWLAHMYTQGWQDWLMMIGLVGLLCIIAYTILWVIIWTGKWVWRGRTI